QYVCLPPVRELPEGSAVARGLDGALGIDIESEASRAGHESNVPHRSISQNQEADLRKIALLGRGPIPPLVDLGDDVAEILRKRKRQARSLDRRDIGTGAGSLAR